MSKEVVNRKKRRKAKYPEILPPRLSESSVGIRPWDPKNFYHKFKSLQTRQTITRKVFWD